MAEEWQDITDNEWQDVSPMPSSLVGKYKKQIETAFGTPEGYKDILGQAAGLGRSLVGRINVGAENLAEQYGLPGAIAGGIAETGAEVAIPQSRLGVALSAIPALAALRKGRLAVQEMGAAIGKALPETVESIGITVPKVVEKVREVPVIDELEKLQRIISSARANDTAPELILTSRERGLYERFKPQLDQAVAANAPIRAIIPEAKEYVKEAVEEMVDIPARQAIRKASEFLPPTAQESFIAQALKAYPKVSEKETIYLLRHPDLLSRAKTVEEATTAYAQGVGLKGKVVSIGERIGKYALSPGDYDRAINRVGKLADGDLLTPQDALEGLQTINETFRVKESTRTLLPGQARRLGELKDKLLDFLENTKIPEIRKLATDLREAYIRDSFSSWLPKNKFGSVDALRSVLALFSAAKGAGKVLSGNVPGGLLDIAAGAAVSPRLAGAAMRSAPPIRQTLESPFLQIGLPQSLVGLTAPAKGLEMLSPDGQEITIPPQMEPAYINQGYRRKTFAP